MINRKTGQIILEIPKSGSRSLVQAAIEAHGKKVFACHGHHTLQETLKLMPTLAPKMGEKPLSVVAVIRDPEDRFLSQINEYCHIKSCEIDDAMAACLGQSHVIFKPQWKFLEGANMFEYHCFPLDDCHKAHELVADKPLRIAYHRNKGAYRRRYSNEQIFNHTSAMRALSLYAMDGVIYDNVKHTLMEGNNV